jgi:cyclic-di-AMP phosphodiesterase PgpH
MKNVSKLTKRTRLLALLQFGKRLQIYFPTFFNVRFAILAGTILAIIALFPYTKTVQLFDLPKVGEVAKETIIAPFTFDIIRSHDEVERERKNATDQVLLVLDYDPEVYQQIKKKIANLQESILKISDEKTPDTLKVAIQQMISRELSYNALSILQARPDLFEDISSSTREILEKGVSAVLLVPSMERLTELRTLHNASFDQHLLYDRPYVTLRKDSIESTVRVSDLPIKEIALEDEIKRLRVERNLDDESLATLYEILFAYIQPNVKINGAETMERRQKVSIGVLEISGKVIKDSEIIRKHQEVTPEVIKKLRSLRIALDRMTNVQERRKIRSNNAGRLLLILLPLLFWAFYIVKFEKKLAKNAKHLLALSIILCFQIALIRGVTILLPKLFENSGELPLLVPEYLIPLTTGSILSTILFGLNISFFYTLYISVFFGCVMGFNQYFFMFALLSGIIAGFSTQNIRYRWHFFKAIPPLFLISVICITLWHLIGFKMSLINTLIMNYGLSLISVIVAIFLSMVLITIFEHIFDITTNMTLVELSDLNHPILKRLSIEAAGTYNHSVLVGNLAESAALRIGANALFARVASYYHDIGKIEKADYFVENCLAVDRSRHTKLAPSMSALIICSHVKDGVELARKYHVPNSIQDVILQHHGTSMVSFFYEKALEQDPHKQVQEQEFRYAGPAPQTPESAIIMLADSVEAASRSLGTSSPKLLRELVKKIIRDKFLSSQLDQSDLTLRDLDEIVEGFMPVLQGIFHSRIEYPNKEKEKERDRVAKKG